MNTTSNRADDRQVERLHRFFPSKRFNRMMLAALCFGLCAMSSSLAHAQDFEEDAAAPTGAVAEPEYSSITGTNNVIQAARVPVIFENKVYYVDLTLALKPVVSAKGVVTVEVAPTTKPSLNLIVSNFKAGNYVAPSTVLGGNGLVTISGPGSTAGGATEWALAASPGADSCTYPTTATFYDGPIATNPLAPRLKAAKITSTAYSYGVGSSNCYWGGNVLLGFAQIGDTIQVVLFTDPYNNVDQNTSIGEVTYTLTK